MNKNKILQSIIEVAWDRLCVCFGSVPGNNWGILVHFYLPKQGFRNICINSTGLMISWWLVLSAYHTSCPQPPSLYMLSASLSAQSAGHDLSILHLTLLYYHWTSLVRQLPVILMYACHCQDVCGKINYYQTTPQPVGYSNKIFIEFNFTTWLKLTQQIQVFLFPENMQSIRNFQESNKITKFKLS